MNKEHMYLSLLVKLNESNRLNLQSELCNLRDSIAREYNISILTVQADFESMATCAKHTVSEEVFIGDILNKYSVVRAWFHSYRSKGLDD